MRARTQESIALRRREIELQMFWEIASQANYLKHNDPNNTASMVRLLHEAEAIVIHTEWPLLRQVLSRRLNKYMTQYPKMAALCALSG